GSGSLWGGPPGPRPAPWPAFGRWTGEGAGPRARAPAPPLNPRQRWRVPGSFVFSSLDAIRFLPEIILIVMGTLLMVLDPLIHKGSSEAFGHLSLLTLVAALGGAWCA